MSRNMLTSAARDRRSTYLACVAAILGLVCVGTAEESLPGGADAFRFQAIATGTRVNTALLDRDGFFWLGSQTGLAKYNGHTFEHFVAGPSSIASNYVNALYQDREGLIWIGTASGLSVYDKQTGRFRTYLHDPDDPHSISNDTITNVMLQAILEDRSGGIWIGTERGLNRFDKSAGGRFTRFPADPDDPEALLDDWVSAIIEDSEGLLWIGTYGGLHRFDPDRGVVVERYPTSGRIPGGDPNKVLDHVSALLEASDGSLWIGTRGGLSRLDRRSRTFTHYQHDPMDPETLGDNFLAALLEDEERNLWITTVGGGLSILPKGSDRFLRVQYDPDDWRPDGISSNFLLNVFSDSSGAIWVISLGGDLYRYDDDPRRFTVYRHHPGFRNSISKAPYIGGMIEDRDGAIWIALAGSGLDRYDRNTDTFTHFRHEPGNPRSLPESYGQAVYEDGDGALWFTSVNWITKLDRRTGEVLETYPAENWPLAPGDDVRDPNVLWMGTAGSGLLRLDKQTGETTYFPPDPDHPETSVSARVIYDIHQEPDGLIWISTLGGGLNVFDPKTEHVVSKYRNDPDDPTSLSSDTVYQFYRAPTGEYWVATDRGLDRFDPEAGTFTHLSKRDGTLPIVGVMSVIADRWGSLWLGGHEGLVRIDPSKNIHRYYGMNREVLKNVGVVFRPLETRDGELWFYDRGITRFRPEAIREEPNLAPVFFTGFTRDGESLNLGPAPERATEIFLDWQENAFEFEVAALDYRNPAASRYRYRLKGVDTDWYEAGSERRGRYVGLPAGDHTLEAMAANEDGVWSEDVASVRVVVEHAPWQTWWAQVLYVAIGLAAVAFLVHQRTRALRAQVRAALQLGSYTLMEKIGEGGMGVVYRAKHAMLRRPTVIKLLPPDKVDGERLRRFEREVQLTSELNHPNIVSVYDYGRSSSGVFYYAMEYLDGATLEAVVDLDGPQPPARVVRILGQAAAALAEAHAVNLIHRDIKPANIMLVEQGVRPDVAKVLDFGLVKELEPIDGALSTRNDTLKGTPMYFSPETLMAPNSVDARSDIYALGAVGYFLLTGTHVFSCATVAEVCSAHLHSDPMPPSERMGVSLPSDLEGLILRCLSKAPADRPQSAAALQVALHACTDAGVWTDQDAQAWWDRHRSAITGRRDRKLGLESGVTLVVDRRRTAGASVTRTAGAV